MSIPDGLSLRAGALFDEVMAGFVLSSSEVEVLRQACVALDRADQAASIIEAEGPVVRDRYGSAKAHPACDIESRSRALFARLIGQLGVGAGPSSVPRVGARPGPRTPRRSE